MPGDEWQRFANLRLLFGYMFAQPGKKLLFMGDEFGQVREWAHDSSLEWDVLQYPVHHGMQNWVEQLNRRLSQRACPARIRHRSQRIRVDRLQRQRRQHAFIAA